MKNSMNRILRRPPAAWDELPKLKAYLEAVGADQSLDEKEKMVRVQPILFGPRRRKTQADGNGPPKDWKGTEQCSLMFAYVRLCSLFWEKNVEARPAKSNGQSNLIQAKLFLNSIESDSCIRKKRRFNDLGHGGWAKDQNDEKQRRLAPGVIKCGCAERGCRLKPAFHCGRNAGFSRQLRTHFQPHPLAPGSNLTLCTRPSFGRMSMQQ